MHTIILKSQTHKNVK